MSVWLNRLLVGTLVAGCASKPVVKAPLVDKPQSASQAVDEAPDLSPVPRPREVVVTARLARPKLLFETIAGWASLPIRLDEALPREARGLSQAVLFEAPMDALVALDSLGQGKFPGALAVVSVGLRSIADALSLAEQLQFPTRRVAPGIHRVGEWEDASCAIAASVGASPARLVCGRSKRDVDALLPYATRGLPKEPQTGADFELTLDAGPIQARYGGDVAAARLFAGMAVREVALDAPRFDRALSDAIYGATDELINVFTDLDRLHFEARLDAQRSLLAVSGELRLKGESSWISGTMAAIKSTDVPAALPRLPFGTTSASYVIAMPSERYAAAQRILSELLEGFLEHHKVPEASRKRVSRVVEGMLAKGPENFSFTLSPPRPETAAPAQLGVDTTVSRISEPAARMTAVLNDLAGILADPALKRWSKQKASIAFPDKAWPKLVKKPLKIAGFKAPAVAYEVSVDLEAWAKVDKNWARALEHALPSGTNGAGVGPARWTLVIQPEGNYTYLASGKDSREIARVMAEHRKAEPGMTFARPLKPQKVMAAGFFTLALLARRLEMTLREPELGTALSAAPHHGETPIPFATSTGRGYGRFDLELPAAVFADIAATAMRAGPMLTDSLKKAGAEGVRSTDGSFK